MEINGAPSLALLIVNQSSNYFVKIIYFSKSFLFSLSTIVSIVSSDKTGKRSNYSSNTKHESKLKEKREKDYNSSDKHTSISVINYLRMRRLSENLQRSPSLDFNIHLIIGAIQVDPRTVLTVISIIRG
jgi:hypothetical protein